jgi:hypothetical protein
MTSQMAIKFSQSRNLVDGPNKFLKYSWFGRDKCLNFIQTGNRGKYFNTEAFIYPYCWTWCWLQKKKRNRWPKEKTNTDNASSQFLQMWIKMKCKIAYCKLNKTRKVCFKCNLPVCGTCIIENIVCIKCTKNIWILFESLGLNYFFVSLVLLRHF